MSKESATRFLKAVSQDEDLRNRFSEVASAEDFLSLSDHLGFCFTTAELKELVRGQSEEVKVRRTTGVWKWLRSLEWL
jgi:predicted ribosomally synthesized peptide with nif11-like leader